VVARSTVLVLAARAITTDGSADRVLVLRGSAVAEDGFTAPECAGCDTASGWPVAALDVPVVHGAVEVSSETAGVDVEDEDEAPPQAPAAALCRLSSDICSRSCSRPVLTCRVRATEAALRGAPCRPARSESSRWDWPFRELRQPSYRVTTVRRRRFSARVACRARTPAEPPGAPRRAAPEKRDDRVPNLAEAEEPAPVPADVAVDAPLAAGAEAGAVEAVDEVVDGAAAEEEPVEGVVGEDVDGVVTDGVDTVGLETFGVVTAGVVTDGVVTDGVVTGGTVPTGVVTGGVVTVGSVTCGVVTEGTVTTGVVTLGRLSLGSVAALPASG
jgi:hypothetical protein